jgi:hypothetical protein
MQSLATHLLAVRDESGKLIFGALVFVIWVIGSIVSSIKKGADARKVQLEKQKMAATRAAMRLPAVAQAHPKWQPPKAPVSRKAAKRRPPPIPKKPPPSPAREPEPIMMQVVEQSIDDRAPISPVPARAATSAARSGTATAAALNRWLNPRTMRQQFILTELLQPPITMREERVF